MLIRAINFQTLHKTLAQLVLWQHPENRLTDYSRRVALDEVADFGFSKASGIQRVPAVDLRFPLLPGQAELLRINNDDMVPRHEKRGIMRAMFSGKDGCGFRRDASKYLIICVNHVPFIQCRSFGRGHKSSRRHMFSVTSPVPVEKI